MAASSLTSGYSVSPNTPVSPLGGEDLIGRGRRAYLSGSITRDPDYKRKFKRHGATWALAGWHVVLPTENGLPDHATWDEHMRVDLEMLETCDAIVMLPCWLKSQGAHKELEHALRLGKRVFFERYGVVAP